LSRPDRSGRDNFIISPRLRSLFRSVSEESRSSQRQKGKRLLRHYRASQRQKEGGHCEYLIFSVIASTLFFLSLRAPERCVAISPTPRNDERGVENRVAPLKTIDNFLNSSCIIVSTRRAFVRRIFKRRASTGSSTSKLI
jgi:hypothetical protein